MPLQIASHPEKPPNFSSAHPPGLGKWMLSLACLVIVSWSNLTDGNLLSLDVGAVINFISNLRRRTMPAKKLARSNEALANLDIGKRHTSLKVNDGSQPPMTFDLSQG